MSKKSQTRKIQGAYHQDELARILTLREDRFGRAFGMETVRVEPKWKSYRSDRSELPEDYYHFRDNNSAVLAVAHLDTVVRQQGRVPHFRNTERGPLVTSGALDDRLGAYVILSLLPKLGVTCDWLLTVGEESGQSTAEHFNPGGKKYDWVIEFDRGGTDVVMYQYEDAASERLLEAAGAVMDWGSFSDIAYLEHLGVKAFNWGVGYGGNYHSEAGYAYLRDTFRMVGKYLRFHEQNAGTRLPHDPDQPRYGSRSYDSDGYYRSGSRSSGSSRSKYYDKYDDYYGDCDSCGEKNVVDSVTWYCTFCGVCQDCGGTDPDVAAEWNDPDVDICQCYAPEKLRASSADERQERDDWTGMTWSQYLARRPGPDSPDDDAEEGTEEDVQSGLIARESARRARVLEALEDAHAEAQAKDGPGPLISAAPPWSEHRPDVSHGLGVPTSRNPGGQSWNREIGPWAAADPPGDTRSYADRLSEEKDRMTARFSAASGQAHGLSAEGDDAARSQWMSAVNPPAVFPDADQGWHEAARNGDLNIVAHRPGQRWAKVCLRCAARWPHPVSGEDFHPEADCPGCRLCTTSWWTRTGTKHVIAAHLPGDSDTCSLCSDALSGADRGDAPAHRALMRALDERADESGATPGLVSQEAADRYLADPDS